MIPTSYAGTRALKQRNLFGAEIALREMGTPSVAVALTTSSSSSS